MWGHCSLILKEEREKTVFAREIEVKGKTKERRKRESSERRREMADLLVLPRPAESLQNGVGFSGKT